MARAIRIAREMALLPYSVRQVTQRSRGGRRDRGDRDRGDRDRGDRDWDRMPEPPPQRGTSAGADNGGATAPTKAGTAPKPPPRLQPTQLAPAVGEDQS